MQAAAAAAPPIPCLRYKHESGRHVADVLFRTTIMNPNGRRYYVELNGGYPEGAAAWSYIDDGHIEQWCKNGL